jgi:hypothetical protein
VTTGHVERMHTYNQTSFRATRKVRRQAEGAIYHCYLRKSMAYHTMRGRLDFSRPQNDAKYAERLGLKLAKSGKRRWKTLPGGGMRLVIRRRVARVRGSGLGNVKWRYIFHSSGSARLARGGARQSRAEEKRARAEWGRKWDAMSLEAREHWKALHILPNFNNDVAQDLVGGAQDIMDVMLGEQEVVDTAIDPSVRSRQSFPVDMGDDIWPLSVQRFADFLASQAATRQVTEWRGGIVALGEGCRGDMRSRMCVGYDPALKPVLRVPITCWELHPGICRSNDAIIFNGAMALALTIHAQLKRKSSGTFFSFVTHGYRKLFCLASKRFANPALMVFVDVDRNYSDDEDLVWLRTFRGKLTFKTSYAIARDLALSSTDADPLVSMFEYRTASVLHQPLLARLAGHDDPVVLREIAPVDAIGAL